MKPAHETIRERIRELRAALPAASAEFLLFALEMSMPTSHAISAASDGDTIAAAEAWHRAPADVRARYCDQLGKFVDDHAAAAKAAATPTAGSARKGKHPR